MHLFAHSCLGIELALEGAYVLQVLLMLHPLKRARGGRELHKV